MAHTQDNRHIAITTPLGKDVLLLRGLSGHEAMSRLFSFELDLLSEEDPAIDFDDHRRQERHHRGQARRRHPLLQRHRQPVLAGRAATPSFATYRAEVVPWLWLLTQTADCRIFQNMTVPDIIQKVFKDLGFTDFKLSLAGTFRAARLLRAVPGDRLQLRQPADGAGRHLLLLRARGRQAHAGAGRHARARIPTASPSARARSRRPTGASPSPERRGERRSRRSRRSGRASTR